LAPIIEPKLLVLLQVNCKSIYNKCLEFWNINDTYKPDVVIGTEFWFSEEISNAEVFRGDYTTFRRDRHTRGGGVIICVKKLHYLSRTMGWRGIWDNSSDTKKHGPKYYIGNFWHLQSSKLRHAVVRKTGRPDRI
jgi:hypothetical protein